LKFIQKKHPDSYRDVFFVSSAFINPLAKANGNEAKSFLFIPPLIFRHFKIHINKLAETLSRFIAVSFM